MTESTLIRQAEIYGTGGIADVRLRNGLIEAVQINLQRLSEDTVVEASGAALLPGLHDHHIHLVSLAAALDSLRCGPPSIHTGPELAAALQSANTAGGKWLRGIGYHPSVAGDIDRHWLDRHVPDRPVRIQHRGGRLWVLNSAALQALGLLSGTASKPAGLEVDVGAPTGRLYEEDVWLRERIGSRMPGLGAASRLLAGYGITGITDTTPHNGVAEWTWFQRSLDEGSLLQRVRMMGGNAIPACTETASLRAGELKIHLLESQLPALESLCADIADAHRQARAVAVHCVTLTELVFTLAAFRSTGTVPGDRIEHASVCPDEQLREIQALGLRVVTQPHFIAERGDQYLREVDAADRPWLYRCKAFLDAGIPLAAGSDASFGGADPWTAMRAAVARCTGSGTLMGGGERLTPEEALALYLSPLAPPGLEPGGIQTGVAADLCLLDRPWADARERLDAALVSKVWRDGELIHRVE